MYNILMYLNAGASALHQAQKETVISETDHSFLYWEEQGNASDMYPKDTSAFFF